MTAHPNPAKAVECVEQLLARDWSMVVQTDEYRAGRERANDDVRQALADAADRRVFPVAEDPRDAAIDAVRDLCDQAEQRAVALNDYTLGALTTEEIRHALAQSTPAPAPTTLKLDGAIQRLRERARASRVVGAEFAADIQRVLTALDAYRAPGSPS